MPQTITLPDGVIACAVICVGDTDNDGKVGVKPLIFGDVPDWLDGKAGLQPIEFVNALVPEVDDVPIQGMMGVVGNMAKQIAPMLGMVIGFVKRK